ncbi:MAG: 4Fe-4S ferredoxin, partial [Acidobacteriota bacterium]|nr:4Fe-4S ferredoxin [Acidobacteriota bacterium]
PAAVPVLSAVLAAAVLVHLLLVAGEVTLPHSTAHGRLAVQEMTSGRFRAFFWSGALLAAVALAAPWLAPAPAAATAVLALGGLLAFEHAYVQAGQSVPLA